MNDKDREQCIDNDDGLYCWWRSSRQSKREFIKENRKELTECIERVLDGRTPHGVPVAVEMAGLGFAAAFPLRPGKAHRTHRLFRRSPAGAGDAGDGDGNIRGGMRERATCHRLGGDPAHRAVLDAISALRDPELSPQEQTLACL